MQGLEEFRSNGRRLDELALNGCCSFATAPFPSLQKFLCLVEREALCAYRRHNINGTKQCKKISNLLDQNSNQPASVRISASRSVRSCLALGIRRSSPNWMIG
jgi:hypothetical protein